MNKSLIPWCDRTWNPIVGCEQNCPDCYARKIATTRLSRMCNACARFVPHLHVTRVGQPHRAKQPMLIFADSMGDWWGPNVDSRWRYHCMLEMADSLQHQFVVLTKRPDLIDPEAAPWPSNAWLGVSITSGADWWRWEALAKLPGHIHKFISVEPLLGEVAFDKMPWRITDTPGELPSWCIVGPMSGKNAIVPDEVWQRNLRYVCALRHIPLFEKFGLPLQPAIRKMPPELKAVFRKGGLTE